MANASDGKTGGSRTSGSNTMGSRLRLGGALGAIAAFATALLTAALGCGPQGEPAAGIATARGRGASEVSQVSQASEAAGLVGQTREALTSTLGAPTTAAAGGCDTCGSIGAAGELVAAACRTGRRVGASADFPQIVSEPGYSAALAREFDAVTTGNTLKWGVVQAVDPDHWDFTQADAIVAFAEEHHQAIKGHTLLWHQQLPPFVNESLDPDLLRQYLRTNIRREVGRYRGRVSAWDVVNEAVDDGGAGLRNTIFFQKLGADYIAWAFREAHQADPRAELFYNDYDIETINPKSNSVLAMVEGLLAVGVPIDGVGFQMHFDAATAPDTADMVANLSRFTALGLSVNISELDVTVASLAASEAEKLAVQKQVYQRATAACLGVPGCRTITTWGFTDKYSWRAPDEALELDTQYGRKPAYFGMVDGLAGVAPDPVGTAPNLIPNGTFEAGLDGWAVSGGELAWRNEASRAHTGQASARVTDRAATTDGATVDISKRVVAGRGYDVSAWARIVGALSDQVSLGATITCPGMPDVTVTLATVTASRSAWTALTGSLQVPACALGGNVTLFISGPQPGVGLAIDDVAVRAQPEPHGPNLLSNPGFEAGDTGGWTTWGPTIAATSTVAHSGTYAASVSGRTATWQGPVLPLAAVVIPGVTYAARIWARIEGATSTEVDFTLKTTCGGVDSYARLGQGTATDSGWIELSGSFVIPVVCKLDDVAAYVEGPSPGIDILVDDAAVEQLLWHPTTASVVSNPDFESGSAGWAPFGSGAMSGSTTYAHSGSQSGLDSGRTATWNGPSYTLPTGAASYAVSAWVYQVGAESLDLLLTTKLVCGDSTTYPTVAGPTTVVPGSWVALSGGAVVPSGCTTVLLYLNQSAGDSFPDLYIDDVTVAPR